MKGIERQILVAVQELREAKPASIARRIGVRVSMVGAACEALVEDGCLLRRGEQTYGLSQTGRDAVSKVVSRGFIPVLKGGGW